MRILLLTVTLLLSANATASAPAPRKVPCPAQCSAGEVADSTQKCVQHDKELYKIDGIGCRKYETECYCKPEPKPVPPVVVL